MLKFSVAICTYNREKYLPLVLDSIYKQTLDHSAFEIILINNNSPGNTKEISDDFSSRHPDLQYHYFLETKQGLSHARNRAIEEAKGEYITFIDDDAFPDKNYLQLLSDYFDQHKDVYAIGGKILLHYEQEKPTWENRYLNSLLGYFNPGNTEKVFTKSDYPRGSNMTFRTAVFQKIGHFDPSLGRTGGNLIGGEEKDIFHRIYKAGNYKVIYLPTAVVYHAVPIERTTDSFIRNQAINTGKSEKIRTKNQSPLAVFIAYLKEFLIKWPVSILLFFVFLFKGQYPKGRMILLFRFWVSKGLIS